MVFKYLLDEVSSGITTAGLCENSYAVIATHWSSPKIARFHNISSLDSFL